MAREVYGAFYDKFRVRVFPSTTFWLRQPCWRFQIERKFVSWDTYEDSSRPYKTKQEAIDAGNSWLDDFERAMKPKGELIEDRVTEGPTS